MKPAASCSAAPTSRASRAICAPMTACISPRPARESLRIMSSAKSRGYWRRAPDRSRCRPNPRHPMPTRSRASRRRVRSQARSCRWWRLRSAPTNCLAARDRGRRPSMRSPRERWSRASRWRRPPDVPMIFPGRDVRSDANRPRAKRRWPTPRLMARCREHRARPLRRRSRRRRFSRPSHHHRSAICLGLARAPQNRPNPRSHKGRACRVRPRPSVARRRCRDFSRANCCHSGARETQSGMAF